MGKIEYIFCSTFHDPEFRLKNLIKLALPKLKQLFIKGIICLTPYTSDDVLNFLKREGFIAFKEQDARQIDIYKRALKKTLDNFDDSSSQRIFHIDFDRLIHWINSYPDELTYILQNYLDVDYLHIGRTPRAFETHPTTQKKTELIVNEIGSKILGFNDLRDIISVCYIITKGLGQRLLGVNNHTTSGFYGSWPIYLWNWATTKKYVEVEGHEWETPDRFKEDIEKVGGYEKWIKKFQSSEEWNKRVRFLHDCLLELFECINP